MPTPSITIDIVELFHKQFGSKPYLVPGISDTNTNTDTNDYRITESNNEKEFTQKGSLLKEQYNNVEILLPVRFYDGQNLIAYMPYVVVKISGNKNIVRTQLAERMGSVKEMFNDDDYKIEIKGFLIGKDRKWPEDEIYTLRKLMQTKHAITIENALTNIFLSNNKLRSDEQRRVVITGFDLPDVSGGKEHVRPFSMSLESDTVFTLELE